MLSFRAATPVVDDKDPVGNEEGVTDIYPD